MVNIKNFSNYHLCHVHETFLSLKLHGEASCNYNHNCVFPGNYDNYLLTAGDEISVDCSHNHILISLSNKGLFEAGIKRNDLHLNDRRCKPSFRGARRDFFVFNLKNFDMCGMQKQVYIIFLNSFHFYLSTVIYYISAKCCMIKYFTFTCIRLLHLK